MAASHKSFLDRLRYVFFPKDAKGVSFFTRLVVSGFMGADDAWAARPDMPDEKKLIDAVAELSLSAGTSTPPIVIYKSHIPNAASLINGTVIVGTNLMDIIDDKQMRAVLGHELSHHRHRGRDMPIHYGPLPAYLLAHYTIGTTLGAHAITPRRKLAFAAVDVTAVGAILMAQRAYQRSCEFEADKEGAQLTQPQDMIGALEALEARVGEIRAHKAAATGKPVELHSGGWTSLFASHPPTVDRVARLKQMEPGDTTLSSQPISR